MNQRYTIYFAQLVNYSMWFTNVVAPVLAPTLRSYSDTPYDITLTVSQSNAKVSPPSSSATYLLTLSLSIIFIFSCSLDPNCEWWVSYLGRM